MNIKLKNLVSHATARPITESNVVKIHAIIKANGFDKNCPLLVTDAGEGKYCVLSGNHRLAAVGGYTLKDGTSLPVLMESVPCTVVEGYDAIRAATLNIGKSMSMRDLAKYVTTIDAGERVSKIKEIATRCSVSERTVWDLVLPNSSNIQALDEYLVAYADGKIDFEALRAKKKELQEADKIARSRAALIAAGIEVTEESIKVSKVYPFPQDFTLNVQAVWSAMCLGKRDFTGPDSFLAEILGYHLDQIKAEEVIEAKRKADAKEIERVRKAAGTI